MGQKLLGFVEGLDSVSQACVERCVQLTLLNGHAQLVELQEFLVFLSGQDDDDGRQEVRTKYVRSGLLFQDMSFAQKYEKQIAGQLSKITNKSLLNLILDLRGVGGDIDFDRRTLVAALALELSSMPEEVVTFFTEFVEDVAVEEIEKVWAIKLAEPGVGERLWKFVTRSGAPKLDEEAKKALRWQTLQGARKGFKHVQSVLALRKPPVDLKEFLTTYTEHINTAQDPGTDLDAFLRTKYSGFFSLNFLRTELDKAGDQQQSLKLTPELFALISGSLKGELTVQNLDDLGKRVTENMIKNAPVLAKGVKASLTELYTKWFQAEKVTQLRSNQLDGAILDRLVRIVESSWLQLKFVQRLQYYSDFEQGVQMRRNAEAELVTIRSKILQGCMPGVQVPNSVDQFLALLKAAYSSTASAIDYKPLKDSGWLAVYIENQDLSLSDLAEIEEVMWTGLNENNLTTSLQLHTIIQDRVSLTLRTSTLASSGRKTLDVDAAQNTVDKIWRDIVEKYVPAEGSDESSTLDTKRTRAYIRFSLRRIQVVLCELGRCDELEQLATNMATVKDKHRAANFVWILDEFADAKFRELLGTAHTTELTQNIFNKLCNDFKDWSDEKPVTKFKPYFLQALGMVRLSSELKVDADKLATLKQTLDEFEEVFEDNPRENEVRSHFVDTLDALTDSNARYPSKLLKHHLCAHQTAFQEGERLIRRITSKLDAVTTTPTAAQVQNEPRFIGARYANFLHENVLSKLSLSNAKELENSLPGLDAEFLDTITEPRNTETRLMYVQLVSHFGTQPQASFFHDEKFVDRSESMTPSTLAEQLGRFLARLHYNDPRADFLRRVLTKLLVCEPSQLPEPLTPMSADMNANLELKHIYKHLFPHFDLKHLDQWLLTESELELLVFANSHGGGRGSGEGAQDQTLERLVCTSPPDTWAPALLGAVYDQVKEGMKAVVAEENDGWVSTDCEREFKTSFFVSDEGDGRDSRLKWLGLMKRVANTAEEFDVRFSGPDMHTLLKFCRDVPLAVFERLVDERLPWNLTKAVLNECVVEDVRSLLAVVDGQHESLFAELRESVYGFSGAGAQLCELNARLLILIHSRLIITRKTRQEDVGGLTRLLITILSTFSSSRRPNTTKAVFTLTKTMVDTLDATPMSAWERIVRRLQIQAFRFVQDDAVRADRGPTEDTLEDKLLDMDADHGKLLVNSLCKTIDELQLSLDEATEIVGGFGSGEWVLHDQALNKLRKHAHAPSGGNYAAELKAFSEEMRAEILSLDQVVAFAKNHTRNDGNGALFDDAELKIGKMKALLPDYKFKVESGLVGMRRQLRGWTQRVSKPGSWQDKPFPEVMTLRIVALIYCAVQLHFFEDEERKAKKKRDAELSIKKAFKSAEEKKKKEEDWLTPPRATQLVALFILIDGAERGKGRIGEIETGEGKSLIVAMFAAFTAFCGANVNVITSNKVLAEEDAIKFESFYSLFGLTVSNNCDESAKSDSDRRKRYNAHIIYGEVGGFQADLLNTEFHGKRIAERKVDVVIVDEVDSLLLDKGANMLYLSHEIPELRHLRALLLIVWEAVQKINEPTRDALMGREYSEHDLVSVRKAVAAKLREVPYPRCLESFVQERLSVWVKQAFRARFMPIDVDFIVDEKGERKVVNMDKDTGVEQANMQLSLALQQFLQLRCGSKISPESLKCVFMSNRAYFRRYLGCIFGISGTLGGGKEMDILRAKYELSPFGMPKFKLNKRVEQPAVVCKADEEFGTWLAAIRDSILAHPEQPILIISETVARQQLIQNFIDENAEIRRAGREVREYKSSEKDKSLTKEINDEGGLRKIHVVNSTNLAGRGTDFKIHKEVRLGLHVIITFLPPNLRVQKQAVGRTGRAGEIGTFQFILQVGSPAPLCILKQERELREDRRLTIISTRDLPRIELEDMLFEKYSKLVTFVRSSSYLNVFPKRVRTLQLEFLNNRWALWLDSMREKMDALHLQPNSDSIREDFETFKGAMQDRLSRSSYGGTLFAEYPSELIKLGVRYETVATKSIVGALSQMEWDEAGNVTSESLEKMGQFGKHVWSVVTDPLQGLSHAWDAAVEYHKRPSDLKIGISALEQANREDDHFTEAGSAYLATLNLQHDPAAKKVAKRALCVAALKIQRSMHLHQSCTHLLDEINKLRAMNNEANLPSVNRMVAQMQSEINLHQHQLDSIHSALHAGLSSGSLRSIVTLVKSGEEAEELFKILLTLGGGHIKSDRLSRKRVPRDPGFSGEAQARLQFLRGSLTSTLCKLGKNSTVTPSTFEAQVTTKAEFIALLQENGVIAKEDMGEDKKYVIMLNKEVFQEYKKLKTATFPRDLWAYEQAIRTILFRNLGKAYDEDRLFKTNSSASKDEATIELSTEQRESLLKFFIAANWVQPGSPSRKILKTIDLDSPEGIPAALAPFRLALQELKLDKKNAVVDGELELAKIPFPDSRAEGAKEIFKFLQDQRVIKQPKLGFPTLSNRKEIEGRVGEVQKALGTLAPKFRAIFDKYHPQKEEKTQDAKVVAKEREKLCLQYLKQLEDYLIGSVGTLKRYPKIRVRYEDLSTRVPLENNEYCSELLEWKRDGVFDRLFTFDESLAWYANPAWFVVLLGVAEIAAGVALEAVLLGSGLWFLSPIAGFLISEGGSDLYYATKSLWKGQRVEGANYWEYKKESMVLSALTCWTGGVGRIGVSVLKTIGKELLIQAGKSGFRALLETFVEDNLSKSVDSNLAGVGNLIDGVMETAEFQKELDLFQANAEALRVASFEAGQVEEFLREMLKGMASDDSDGSSSTFNLGLERLMQQTGKRFVGDVKSGFFRRTMPLQSEQLAGLFGYSQKAASASFTQVQHLSVDVLQSFNKQMAEKAVLWTEEKVGILHKDERCSKEEFGKTVAGLCTTIKSELRRRVADSIYQHLCSPAQRQRLKSSFISTYDGATVAMREKVMSGTALAEHLESGGKMKDDDDYEDGEGDDVFGEMSRTSGGQAKNPHLVVSNAGNATVSEVIRTLKEKSMEEKDYELLEDNFGRCFVHLKGTGEGSKPTLSTQIHALEEYLATLPTRSSNQN